MNTTQASVVTSEFLPVSGRGTGELHLLVSLDCPEKTFDEQCAGLLDAYDKVKASYPSMKPVFERYFLSDSATQQGVLERLVADRTCAVSIVEQPPLNGTKIALLAVMQGGVDVCRTQDGLTVVSAENYSCIYSTGMTASTSGSGNQTREILLDYCEKLDEFGLSLADDCVRTWFFVQNIDANYSGVVSGRNEVFNMQGLTDTTHFISSTGIGGRTCDTRSLVMMDAVAAKGLLPGQMRYLYAPTHLNRTSEYGVSFERGTVVEYGDRRHIFISGTASIDNKGQILFSGDIRRQTVRMLENVQTLLNEAGCTFDDAMHMIVYLRDMADYRVVSEIFSDRFPDKPCIIVYAPVCRPGWLVEMECFAIGRCGDLRFPAF